MLCHILIGPSDTVMFPTLVIFSFKKNYFCIHIFINGVLGRNQMNQYSFFCLIIKLISQQDQCNYYNQGALRKQELLRSCALLGIPDFKITILDHRSFPDDPKAEWNISLVSTVIMNHIESHAFNLVLTFDGRGVSSHANHIAIHKAVSHLALTGQVPNDCCFLKLVTVGLFRKYMSFLELPLSWLMPSSLFCCVGLHGYRLAKEAMFCHRTQLLWFRYLYVTFSRYMYVNTFQSIPQAPRNLKIY
ncbi:N-acetylglucosaminyl-phosphatidylinositol de-N-acetylase isoform X6 [Takifugu flavidus]|nr:N-acetylglucosaminyl-phosphatidylinositol de-N-acetylase isoform X6 [Takifugu flavidus]